MDVVTTGQADLVWCNEATTDAGGAARPAPTPEAFGDRCIPTR